jgi:hypothetical protein
MSLRVLYRKVPSNRRTCNYYRCQKPILRNIDRDKDGRLYHHGCLMNAEDEYFRCQDCYLTFDATEAVFEERQRVRSDDFSVRLRAVCPNCGSPNVKRTGMFNVGDHHHRMPDGKLVEVSA